MRTILHVSERNYGHKKKKHRPAGLDEPRDPLPQCVRKDHKGSRFYIGGFTYKEEGYVCWGCLYGD